MWQAWIDTVGALAVLASVFVKIDAALRERRSKPKASRGKSRGKHALFR